MRNTPRSIKLCLGMVISLFLLASCFQSPPQPVVDDPELGPQAVESHHFRLWHKGGKALLTWTNVGGSSGNEEIKAKNVSRVAFPILELDALGGNLEVGGGEGYGIYSPLDNGKTKKTINGAETLYLTLPANTPARITDATLQFRMAKDSTQDVLITAKEAGEVVDSQTFSISSSTSSNKSDSLTLSLAAPADQLVFSAAAGSKLGLLASTFETQDAAPSQPGPITEGGKGEVRLSHKGNKALLNWVGVNGNGAEERKQVNGLTDVTFPIFTVSTGDGVLEVGGGEGFGVKGAGDDGKTKKTLEGNETLSLSLTDVEHKISHASLQMRIRKGTTQSFSITSYLNGQQIDVQSFSQTSVVGKDYGERFTYTPASLVDSITIQATGDSKIGVLSSTFFTVSESEEVDPPDPDPTGDFLVELNEDFSQINIAPIGEQPFTIDASNLTWVASEGELSFDVTFSNTNAISTQGVRAIFTDLASTGMTFVDEDGLTSSNNPFLDVGTVSLESTVTVPLLFEVPSTGARVFTISLEETAEAFSISSVSPQTFNNDAERIITVTGKAFTPETIFHVMGTALEPVGTATETDISLKVPAGYQPDSYDIGAFKLGGAQAQLSNAFTVTEGAAPPVLDPIDNYQSFISGYVLDAETFEPLPGAKVSVYNLEGLVGPTGMYLIQGFPMGEHTIRIEADGYEAVQRTVLIETDDEIIYLPEVLMFPERQQSQGLQTLAEGDSSAPPLVYSCLNVDCGRSYSYLRDNNSNNNESEERTRRAGRWVSIEACVRYDDGTPANGVYTNLGRTDRSGNIDVWRQVPRNGTQLTLELSSYESGSAQSVVANLDTAEGNRLSFPRCLVIAGGDPDTFDFDDVKVVSRHSPNDCFDPSSSTHSGSSVASGISPHFDYPEFTTALVIKEKVSGIEGAFGLWSRRSRQNKNNIRLLVQGEERAYYAKYPHPDYHSFDWRADSVKVTSRGSGGLPIGMQVNVTLGILHRGYSSEYLYDTKTIDVNVIDRLVTKNVLALVLPDDAVPSSTLTPYVEETDSSILHIYRESDVPSGASTVTIPVPVTAVDRLDNTMPIDTYLEFAFANASSGTGYFSRGVATIPVELDIVNSETADLSKLAVIGGDGPILNDRTAPDEALPSLVEGGDCVEVETFDEEVIPEARSVRSIISETYEDLPFIIRLLVDIVPFGGDALGAYLDGPDCAGGKRLACVTATLAVLGMLSDGTPIGHITSPVRTILKTLDILGLADGPLARAMMNAVAKSTKPEDLVNALDGPLLRLISNPLTFEKNLKNVNTLTEDIVSTLYDPNNSESYLEAYKLANNAIANAQKLDQPLDKILEEIADGTIFKGGYKDNNAPFKVLTNPLSNEGNIIGSLNEIVRANFLNKSGGRDIEFLGRQVHSTGGFDVDVKSVFDGQTFFDQVKTSTNFTSEAAKNRALSNAGDLVKGAVEFNAKARWVISDTTTLDIDFVNQLKNICRNDKCLEVVDINGNPL